MKSEAAGNSRFKLILLSAIILMALSDSRVLAQHTRYEAAIEGAFGGQSSLAGSERATRGFYSSPFLWRGRFAFTSTGAQSLSVFLERVIETRSYSELFAPAGLPSQMSELRETLGMTTIGIEFIRTILSESGFRVGFGLGVGYGMGGADLHAKRQLETREWDLESCQPWHGMLATALARARYTFYSNGEYDLGATATARYWGFPTIGPVGDCADSYNGPDLRSLHEIGYLIGLSLGF